VCISGSLDVDEYDLVDPVDILTPLGKSGFWDGVVSA
jgi:cytoskeleton-associated protein 5